MRVRWSKAQAITVVRSCRGAIARSRDRRLDISPGESRICPLARLGSSMESTALASTPMVQKRHGRIVANLQFQHHIAFIRYSRCLGCILASSRATHGKSLLFRQMEGVHDDGLIDLAISII